MRVTGLSESESLIVGIRVWGLEFIQVLRFLLASIDEHPYNVANPTIMADLPVS